MEASHTREAAEGSGGVSFHGLDGSPSRTPKNHK